VIEAIPASNDVNLPGLATTETLTRHVNLNYFSEVSWEGEERLADADFLADHGQPASYRSSVGLVSINALVFTGWADVGLAFTRDCPPMNL
jgi:hypothetical protein